MILLKLSISAIQTVKVRQQSVYRTVYRSSLLQQPIKQICPCRLVIQRQISSSQILNQFKFGKQSPLPG